MEYINVMPTISVATGISLVNIRLLLFSTSDFYVTVWYKLNASISLPITNSLANKVRNPHWSQNRVEYLHLKSRLRVTCMLFLTQCTELLQFGTITNTRGWEIDEKYIKIMNLTYFHPKMRGNVENKNNSPVNIRLAAKTSENYLITSDVKTSEVARLTMMLDVW